MTIANNGANGTTDIVDYAGGFGTTDLFDGNGGYGKGMGSNRDSAAEPQPRTDGPGRERSPATSAGQLPDEKGGGRSMEHRRTRQCSLSSSDIGWRLGGGEGDGASNPGCHDAGLGTDSFVHQMPGELTLNWHEGKAHYLWVCARGDPNCKFTWSGVMDLNSLMAAFEIRLCLVCQQEALKPHELRDRMAWRCPRCLDQILASEWDDVMATFLRAGGYNPDRTHKWLELGKP